MSYVITNAKKFVAHSVGKQPVQGEYAAFKPENAGPFQSTWRLFIFGPNGSEVAEYPSEKLLLSALRKIAGDSLKIQSISTLTIEQRDKAIAAGVHSSQMPPTASRSGENFDSKARLDAAKQAMIDAGQQSAGSPEALRAQLKQQQQRAQTPAQALAMTPEQEAIEISEWKRMVGWYSDPQGFNDEQLLAALDQCRQSHAFRLCVKLLNDLFRELLAGNLLEHPRGPQRGVPLPRKLYRTPLPVDFAAAALAEQQQALEQAAADVEAAKKMPLDELRKQVRGQFTKTIRDGRVVRLEGR